MHLPRSRLYWRLFGQVRIDGWNANWAVIDAKNIPDKSRYGKGLACRDMADAARVIVIEGTREDWPGGPRTLTPLDPDLEPNRRTYWFGAALAPAGPGCGSGSPGRSSARCRRPHRAPVATAWSTSTWPGSATTPTTSGRTSTASRSPSRMPVIRGSNPTVTDFTRCARLDWNCRRPAEHDRAPLGQRLSERQHAPRLRRRLARRLWAR